jgi:hypothetical protein
MHPGGIGVLVDDEVGERNRCGSCAELIEQRERTLPPFSTDYTDLKSCKGLNTRNSRSDRLKVNHKRSGPS